MEGFTGAHIDFPVGTGLTRLPQGQGQSRRCTLRVISEDKGTAQTHLSFICITSESCMLSLGRRDERLAGNNDVAHVQQIVLGKRAAEGFLAADITLVCMYIQCIIHDYMCFI